MVNDESNQNLMILIANAIFSRPSSAPTVTLLPHGVQAQMNLIRFFISLLFSTFTVIGEASRCPQ
jgi:hypothetical protein